MKTLSPHHFNLIRDTRPQPEVWSKVYQTLHSRPTRELLDVSIDLGTFDFGVGFRAVFSITTLRQVRQLVVTLTPYEHNRSHTNLTKRRVLMTEKKLASLKE